MKLIKNIKEKVGYIILNSDLKARKRIVTFNNFTSSSTVGIIFDAVNKENYHIARDFMAYVEESGARVFSIGFVPKSELIGYLPFKKGIDYFGLDKELWYGKAQSSVVDEFIERPFDILIDLSLSNLFSIEYIFALSKAKFKICNDSPKTKYADFFLQLKKPENLEQYIEQIKHYLEVIEPKK
ncbi:MAG: hypothetical protein JXR51_09040 [Bacteroidales bacterium]|nr:hypothetical protein [Bacteroidales bacterium]MBN2757308.1 hypothetical protein [Bacteroidales bacterium]